MSNEIALIKNPAELVSLLKKTEDKNTNKCLVDDTNFFHTQNPPHCWSYFQYTIYV